MKYSAHIYLHRFSLWSLQAAYEAILKSIIRYSNDYFHYKITFIYLKVLFITFICIFICFSSYVSGLRGPSRRPYERENRRGELTAKVRNIAWQVNYWQRYYSWRLDLWFLFVSKSNEIIHDTRINWLPHRNVLFEPGLEHSQNPFSSCMS